MSRPRSPTARRPAARRSTASPATRRTAVRPRRPERRTVGIVARIAAVVLLLWLGGFAWFALTLPTAVPLAVTTDAVVVLTGGGGRLARGVAALQGRAAQRMLVSGVGAHISKASLAASVAAPLRLFADHVDLGYAAVDTRSNAIETTAWATRHGYRSLRLVTSAAHMRRARLELAAQLPAAVTLVEDAVPAQPGADSIAREYSKYLLRYAALAAGAA